MGKKNSHIHLLIETEKLTGLKLEANELGTNVNELIRKKLSIPPTPEEIILLRKLKGLLKEERQK
jgi:hypothetical protein